MAIISLNNINWMVFLLWRRCSLYEARSELINIIQMNVRFQRVNFWTSPTQTLSFCHLLDHRLSHSVAYSSRPIDVPPLSAGSKLSVVEPAERYTYRLSACQGWPDTGPPAPPPQPQFWSLPPIHLRLNVNLSELRCSGITPAYLKIYVIWQSNTTFTI
jgi:hypothetical protein